MKTIPGFRGHQYLAMASTFLIVLALIAGIVGCDGGGGETYELTISSTSGGSVTEPGEAGPYIYDEGTVVQLVATPNTDYQFVSWTGDVDTIANINAATTNITMNDDYSITANFESIPPSVPYATSEWARVDTPTMDNFVLAPESVIIDYALAAEGEVAYAAVEAWSDDCWDTCAHRLLKSDDHGATWTDINEALEDLIDVDGGDYIDYLLRVATDWVDPDFVAVALYWWDESAGAYHMHVFFSTDGGLTFEDAGEVEDSGVYFTYMSDVITDLVVTPESGGDRDIFVGGTANSMYGAGLFRCTVTGDSPGAWHDVTDYADYEGWDNMEAPDAPAAGDIASWLVTDIVVSPNWGTDKTILVTTVASDIVTGYQGVYMQSGNFGTSPAWNEFSTLGIEAVEIITDNTGDVDLPVELMYYDARVIAGMTLPEDYDSTNTDTRKLWIWVNYYDPDTGEPICEILPVEDDSTDPWPMVQIEDGEVWLTNVSYKGTIADGEAIAGVLGDGGYPYGGDPTDLFTECCEGVHVYRNDGIADMHICCELWHDACKPPTGQFAMSVSYVADDKAYAVALMGHPDYDEGAWSVTFDDGDVWNQLSLVDTYIDYFSDVAVSPDCNKTMLVSGNLDNGCCCDSVWLQADTLPEAPEYSGKWLRTWCGNFEGDRGAGLLRLAPEETTGDTVFLIDHGTSKVYWNDLETLACWEIGTATVDEIVDLAVKDESTIIALDWYGDVAMSDDFAVGWHTPVDSEVNYGWTIAVWGDYVLVGGQDGDVSYSDDGGETFTALEDIATSGDVTVAFDSYFDWNNTIYAALGDASEDNGVYRWVIDESTEWENLSAENYEYIGLVLDNADGNPMTSPDTGAVLYASYISEDMTGVARCLTPAHDACCAVTDWDYLIEGLTVNTERFQMWPDALKICGCLTPDTNSKLFAIDGNEPYDMCEIEDGAVWIFEDCFAKKAIQLTSPADSATVPANPSTCLNQPFGLFWDRLCNAHAYDIQFALDEDFTLILEQSVDHYMPVALDTPSYLVPEGQLSCDITYYWRVRAVEDETGQIIHSWWSEPWSFTVAAEE